VRTISEWEVPCGPGRGEGEDCFFPVRRTVCTQRKGDVGGTSGGPEGGRGAKPLGLGVSTGQLHGRRGAGNGPP